MDWKDTPLTPNTPPADELADVREQLWRLKAREETLKALILANPDLCEGAHYLAEIKVINTTYTDLKELRANNPDLCAEYTFPKQVTRIEIVGISEDGELTAVRHRRDEGP